MEDRELLELAAKAAGIALLDRPEVHAFSAGLAAAHGNWSPLTDDGDALRLAVQLRLEVSWWRNAVLIETDDKKASSGIVPFGGDAAVATRCAIVRAAAAMATARDA